MPAPAPGTIAGAHGEDYTFIAGEVTPQAALGTRVAYLNDPDGTNREIIRPEGGFAN